MNEININNSEEFVKLCFADDCKNFWENFSKWSKETFSGIYYSQEKGTLYDPDDKSDTLYQCHKILWRKQYKYYEKSIKSIKDIENFSKNERYLDIDGIPCSSDSIISIYWHWADMQEIIKKAKPKEIKSEITKILKEIEPNYEKRYYNEEWDNETLDRNLLKKFIWLYLQKSNTIGGFIVFPKNNLSINVRRGNYRGAIKDRFDLTLECIRRAYQYGDFDSNEINPLFGISEEEKTFFKMFSNFENYINFFCLNPWVKCDYSAVYDLLSEDKSKTLPTDGWPVTHKILPQNSKEWWTFYNNIMSRLKARNQQIKEVIERK